MTSRRLSDHAGRQRARGDGVPLVWRRVAEPRPHELVICAEYTHLGSVTLRCA